MMIWRQKGFISILVILTQLQQQLLFFKWYRSRKKNIRFWLLLLPLVILAANGHNHCFEDRAYKICFCTGNMISSAPTGSPSSSATIAFDDSGGVNSIVLSSLDLSLMDNSSSDYLIYLISQTQQIINI